MDNILHSVCMLLLIFTFKMKMLNYIIATYCTCLSFKMCNFSKVLVPLTFADSILPLSITFVKEHTLHLQ